MNKIAQNGKSQTTTDFGIINLTDVHLGHYKTPSQYIIDNLYMYLFPLLKQETTKLLLINGDFLDTLLYLNPSVNIILGFIVDLLYRCNKESIVVRVVRGTYSHDRNQMSLFKLLYDKHKFTNDLKYIDKLTYENINSLNRSFIYIPDDLPYEDSYAIIEEVKNLLSINNVSHVDYVTVHGNFAHALPENISLPKCTFSAEQFKDFVKKAVLCGHIHLVSVYENVYFSGSFDRLAHNEEERKGFFYILDMENGFTPKFIENKNAMPYITFNMMNITDLDDIISDFDKRMDKFYKDRSVYGFVRVIHNSKEVKTILTRYVKQNYTNIIFTYKKDKTEKDNQFKLHQMKEINKDRPIPTPDTLPKLIHERLKLKSNIELSEEMIQSILDSLDEPLI
jgi:hypothetical protein